MSAWRSLPLGVLLLFAASAVRADEDAETLFETRVRPLLAQTCFRCHGGEKTAHDLRVDSREALTKGGKSGPAIVPGEPNKSLLLAAIEYRDDGEFQMPPEGKLPADTIAAVATWIRVGAPWPEAKPGAAAFAPQAHWAYQPVKKVEPPADPTGWSEHPIDRFVASMWSTRSASGQDRSRSERTTLPELADKRTLIRRLYFDLIGLPPSPEEVDAFVADESDDAWTKLIDRLLESPHYGERWGRHWMDVVRYADTAGDNADYPVPEARLYRNYIIDAFNADKPYDQFVREQIAGDILAAETIAAGGSKEQFVEQTTATGFLALSRRYATAPYELWHLTLEDTIDTVGRAFLGQTFKCARCHDHKFDPITQQDYYALYGIFASTQFPWAGGEEYASKQFGRQHFVSLVPPAVAMPQFESHAARLKELEEEIKKLEAEKKEDDVKARKAELRDLLRTSVPPGMPCAYGVREGTPADVPIQVKGDPGQSGPVVPRRMPAFVKVVDSLRESERTRGASAPHFEIPSGTSGRLQLAQWLTHPEHPLTVRVMVNRIWQHHFGRGIVATPSNFGTRGELPTHPELLDYLARYFVEHGWSVKQVHRLILTSKTWRLVSDSRGGERERGREGAKESSLPLPLAPSPTLAASTDPDNRYFSRHDRARLDAEAIRDAMLSVAGTLDLSRPGPHPFPDIKTWGWTQHAPFKDVYPSQHRSVYLMTQRIQRHPFLALFDGPDTNTTTDQRTASTVPLQALFWMNSPLVQEQSAAFARRLVASASEPTERIQVAFCTAYSREPTSAEASDTCGLLIGSVKSWRKRCGCDQAELETWLVWPRRY
jgi:cytochrome c553